MAKNENKWTDTSKMPLLGSNTDDPRFHYFSYLARTRETDDAVTEHYIDQRIYFENGKETSRHEWKSSSKKRKYLCIGGPHSGTRQAKPGDDYRHYSTQESSRDKKAPDPLRSVWIHSSALRIAAVAPKKRSRREEDRRFGDTLFSLRGTVPPGLLDGDDGDSD